MANLCNKPIREKEKVTMAQLGGGVSDCGQVAHYSGTLAVHQGRRVGQISFLSWGPKRGRKKGQIPLSSNTLRE